MSGIAFKKESEDTMTTFKTHTSNKKCQSHGSWKKQHNENVDNTLRTKLKIE